MTSQAINIVDELRRIIAEGLISEEALQTITGISGEALASFLSSPSGEAGLSTSPSAYSEDESARLCGLVGQLTAGLQIDDDVRLEAIIETLTVQHRLTLQNIALLTQIELDDVESFLSAPSSVPPEKKYALGLRALYLINAVANAAR